MWENKKKYASSFPLKPIMLSKLKKPDFHKVLNFSVKLSTHSMKTPRGHWEYAVTCCKSQALFLLDWTSFGTFQWQYQIMDKVTGGSVACHWARQELTAFGDCHLSTPYEFQPSVHHSYFLRTYRSQMSKFTHQIKNSFPAQISMWDLVAQPGSSREHEWQNGQPSLHWIPGAGEGVWCDPGRLG